MLVYQRVLMVNWTELFFFFGSRHLWFPRAWIPVSGKTTGSTSRKTRNPLCWSIRKVSTHHLWKCWRTRQGSYMIIWICLWYVYEPTCPVWWPHGGHIYINKFPPGMCFSRASSPYAGPSAATWSLGLSWLRCHQLESSGNKVILEGQWKNITLW